MEKDNLTVLQGKGTPSLSKEALRKMREELPMILELYAITSIMTRAKFNELVREGFTEAQALELCKSLV